MVKNKILLIMVVLIIMLHYSKK